MMEKIIRQNIAIMDRYDPENEVDLIIDEWGTWYEVEPGTNPRFLYQQNTMRDALVAATNLNIFNNHCERVYMSNIAQTVNVLQAMVLTRDNQMVRTPTYYVFKMFADHQEATMLPVDIRSSDYTYEDESIPAMNASASINEEGLIHITLVNMDPHRSRELTCILNGKQVNGASGEILTSRYMGDFNDFGKPESVSIRSFDQIEVKGSRLLCTVPAKSVVKLEIR
jgi:alpha-N-arabinofuranosidase